MNSSSALFFLAACCMEFSQVSNILAYMDSIIKILSEH